jgi:hypothetical protein
MARPRGFVVRRLRYRSASIVNVCDEELLGKTLVDGRLKVDLSEGYFLGERVGEEEAMKLIERTEIVNLVGRRIVGKAVRARLAHPRAVRKIARVPFVMIYKFSA